jgi:hypothetical protein
MHISRIELLRTCGTVSHSGSHAVKAPKNASDAEGSRVNTPVANWIETQEALRAAVGRLAELRTVSAAHAILGDLRASSAILGVNGIVDAMSVRDKALREITRPMESIWKTHAGTDRILQGPITEAVRAIAEQMSATSAVAATWMSTPAIASAIQTLTDQQAQLQGIAERSLETVTAMEGIRGGLRADGAFLADLPLRPPEVYAIEHLTDRVDGLAQITAGTAANTAEVAESVRATNAEVAKLAASVGTLTEVTRAGQRTSSDQSRWLLIVTIALVVLGVPMALDAAGSVWNNSVGLRAVALEWLGLALRR